jgi:hypothetical protein
MIRKVITVEIPIILLISLKLMLKIIKEYAINAHLYHKGCKNRKNIIADYAVSVFWSMIITAYSLVNVSEGVI